ncbi:hypothetical protein Cabys_3372 [Caldithrix abyssi DSM 13497]|uniref:Uncharacterized protein n=1 Tax=Caldithrix abyssi DSM 13497 TaxID=880073 RepID=A0A1J1CDZ6_CALAY|nr:hypothetical protein Cabys_3372 [Caldithrix abyssi DSM 13497]
MLNNAKRICYERALKNVFFISGAFPKAGVDEYLEIRFYKAKSKAA